MKTSAASAGLLPVHLSTGSQSLLPSEPLAQLLALAPSSQEQNTIPVKLGGPRSTPSHRVESVAVSDAPFATALRLAVEGFFDQVDRSGNALELEIPTTADVQRGDVVLIRIWLRCVESADGRGSCVCQFRPRQYDLDKPAEFRAIATGQWTQFCFPFTSEAQYAAGAASLVFIPGFEAQTLEIGGIELANYASNCTIDQLPRSSFTYRGRGSSSAWRREAESRIEQVRKASFSIHVTDSQGRPVPGATVTANLASHEFGFGSCVTVDHLMGTTPDCQAYRDHFLANFNRAVFENDMKWPATDGIIPPALDESVAWLHKHNISVRGHNLVWPAWRWLPAKLQAYSHDEASLAGRVDHHITQLVGHFKGKLTDWDVVNEPYSCHDLLDVLGGESVIADWYRLAQRADPDCRMCINDFGLLEGGRANRHRAHYLGIIQSLLDEGVPLGGIGIQSHFGYDLPSPAELLALFDRFAAFGLPLQSTEFSINCEDPELQADFVRDYATLVFSHPAMEDLVLWGFWAGRHWRPTSGMFNRDWSPKPMARAWAQLQRSWSTRHQSQTDARGAIAFNGFHGTYALTVTHPHGSFEQRVKLNKNSRSASVMLPDMHVNGSQTTT